MSNKNKRIVAIIQARIGSTRLSGKILMDICGYPVIWHIWNRLKNISEIDEIVVATSREQANDILERFCVSENISYFRGSENEVLDRFYQAAKCYHADIIIRITGDCPLIDPQSISIAIQRFLKSETGLDYVGLATGAGVFGKKVNKFPDGTDAEVIAFEALERAWSEATDSLDRGEAVTSYIWRNKDIFKCEMIYCERDLGHLRWTLDRPEDLEFVRKVYKRLYNSDKCFSMFDVLKLLEDEPALAEINKNWIGKENYEKYYNKNKEN
ncbi:glycosyltransferase family protein [Patescibacteria group bacterium]|nr:glycosyltransferase family protein [Patescibacteria group bacterium]